MHFYHGQIKACRAWDATVADIGGLVPAAFYIELCFVCEACGKRRSNFHLIGAFSSQDHELVRVNLQDSRCTLIAEVATPKQCYGCARPSSVSRSERAAFTLFLSLNLTEHLVRQSIRELGLFWIYQGEQAA